MAKPRTPNQKKRYAALNKRLARYVSLVQSVYDQLGLEAANIVTTGTEYDGSKPFRFKDYPATKARVDNLMRYFSHDLQALVYSGTTEEWKQSNLVQDLLANDVLKVYGIRRDGDKVKKYYQPNNDALKAFQHRKDKGMTVSQKLWNQSYNFKRELEYAISSAIEKGQSAVTLSKRISKYLHDFPSLQADYKDRFGTAVDCKDCEYRSIRLARSEINMAYREAEQTRWQQMDFIKGYEIKLSHSHPKHDVCDELTGIYPKWFKWTGWHPNDMCYVVPVVMTDDEWYSGKGQEITELPYNIKEWVNDNTERIEQAKERGTLPYWIKDNYKEFSGYFKSATIEGDIIDVYDITNKNKAYIISNIKDLISKVKTEEGVPLFLDDTVFEFGTPDGNAFMTWDKGRIVISRNVFNVAGEEFCPARELFDAFKNLNEGIPLNKYQEYAIESLYHESIHDRHHKIVSYKKMIPQTKLIETSTQLLAREYYPAILKAFDAKPLYQDEIRAGGFGYRSNCNKLREKFTDNGILDMETLKKIAYGDVDGITIIKSLFDNDKTKALAWVRGFTR